MNGEIQWDEVMSLTVENHDAEIARGYSMTSAVGWIGGCEKLNDCGWKGSRRVRTLHGFDATSLYGHESHCS